MGWKFIALLLDYNNIIVVIPNAQLFSSIVQTDFNSNTYDWGVDSFLSMRPIQWCVCVFLLISWSLLKLCSIVCFYMQISIELRIKYARYVLNWFALFKACLKENFLSYLVDSVYCLYVNQLLSYSCFYTPDRLSGIVNYKPLV